MNKPLLVLVLCAVFCFSAIYAAEDPKFTRTHDELKAVLNQLNILEERLRKTLAALDDKVVRLQKDVFDKEAELKSQQQAKDAQQKVVDAKANELAKAKAEKDAAKSSLTNAENTEAKRKGDKETADAHAAAKKGEYDQELKVYNSLQEEVKKELALIELMRQILGRHHDCDGIVKFDRCYVVLKNLQDITWSAAESKCREYEGHLPSVESADENAFLLQQCGAQWLGGSDELKEGDWRWNDQRTMNFKNWVPGEPNNCVGCGDSKFFGKGENHMEMYADGRWNDIPGTLQRGYKCVVCKKW